MLVLKGLAIITCEKILLKLTNKAALYITMYSSENKSKKNSIDKTGDRGKYKSPQ